MKHGRWCFLLPLILPFLVSMGNNNVVVHAQSEQVDETPSEEAAATTAAAGAAGSEAGAAAGAAESEAPKINTKVVEEEEPAFLAAEPATWGTYYDPKGQFCGQYDCYSILGLDYEKGIPPDEKEIIKRYRRLGRKWHPDKSKHPHAKERFVKIVRAYEVLTNVEKRKEYDFLRYNQEAYYQKYGSSVLWQYAPKSDVTIIVIILLLIMNAFSWYAQLNKWQNVADRLIRAAAEEWSPSQGGSPESKELREHALSLLAERTEQSNNNNSDETNGDDAAKSPASTKKAKGKAKLSAKEKKQKEMEALMPILKELVDEMHDFGGGFHKPTWKDLMIVSLATLPYKLTVGLIWETKYYWNRIQGKELTEEEKQVLTARFVGPVVWDTASEEARQQLIQRELWIKENLLAWKEEEEIKNLSGWEQKMIRKAQKAEKKKGAKQL